MIRNLNKTPVVSLVVLVFCAAAPLSAAPVNIGAVGDSLTDEYSVWAPIYYGSSTARNWTDLVATYRSSELSFGTFANWGGAPRYTGYEYNYARAGATTTTLLSEGQHTGVAGQPVSLVYMGIGTNDFAPETDASLGLVNNYGPIYGGADPTSIINGLVSRFTTALDTIAGPVGSPTGVKVVVGNVADWGVMPFTDAQGYTDPAQKALVTSAIETANAQIEAIAQSRGMPVVDAFGLLNLGLNSPPMTIGDFDVTFGAPASDNQAYFFLPDKTHPGTLWQGLLANSILTAANQAYGTSFTAFTDQELLGYAGITDPNGGAVTSYYPVGSYVIPAPEPSAAVIAMSGMLLVAAIGWKRRVGLRRAA